MVFTYLILNIAFLVCILILFSKDLKKPTKAWWVTLIALLALTAVFDSIIVWANIVAYDPTKILGVYVGTAPLEDFFYAILAVIIVPVLWHRLAPEKRTKSQQQKEAKK